MNKVNRCILSVGLVVSFTVTAVAQGMKTDDQIGYRKATYKFLSLNMRRIKASLKGTFDIKAVKVAALAIQAAAHTRPDTLFGEGTDVSSKYNVKALPEVWLLPEEFAEKAQNLITAADALVLSIESGDKGKIGKAFGQTGKSCKSCHEDFKGK